MQVHHVLRGRNLSQKRDFERGPEQAPKTVLESRVSVLTVALDYFPQIRHADQGSPISQVIEKSFTSSDAPGPKHLDNPAVKFTDAQVDHELLGLEKQFSEDPVGVVADGLPGQKTIEETRREMGFAHA